MLHTDNEWAGAPRNYEELFHQYWDYVVAFLRSHGIEEQNKEDVASECFERFYERDILSMWNPDHRVLYKGQERRVKFKSWLTGFLKLYVLGHRDRQTKQQSRYPLWCDTPVMTGGGHTDSQDITWLELNGEHVDSHENDVVDLISAQESANELRAYLMTIPPRSKNDTCDLPALFDACRDQIDRYGVPTNPNVSPFRIAELADHFGVSTTSMNQWVRWMQDCLCIATDRPLIPRKTRRKSEQ